jgi:hypothetical protein
MSDKPGSVSSFPAVPLKPTENLLGKSGGQLSFEYWNWVFQNEVDELYIYPKGNPENVALHQKGDVWFLGPIMESDAAGVFDHKSVVRDITIPAGKAIVHPFIDSFWNNNAPGSGDPSLEEGQYTEAEARADNAYIQSDITAFAAWVDGVPVTSDVMYTQHRSPAPWQRLDPQPEDDNFASMGMGDATGLRLPLASQGSYLMLPPLSPGKHTIRIVAKDVSGFQWDVTHNITAVEQGKATSPASANAGAPADPLATIVGANEFSTTESPQGGHTYGLAWLLEKGDHKVSPGGQAVIESELNEAIVASLTDSGSPGEIDAGEEKIFRERWKTLEANALPATRGAYDSFFNGDGKGGSVDGEALGQLACYGTNPYSPDAKDLGRDEINQLVVTAFGHVDGEIDAGEKDAINAKLGNLATCAIQLPPIDWENPDAPFEADPEDDRKMDAYAQWVHDALKKAGVL